MFISDCLDTNENNHLQIGGVDTVELAKQYQTDLILAIGPRATTDTSASVPRWRRC